MPFSRRALLRGALVAGTLGTTGCSGRQSSGATSVANRVERVSTSFAERLLDLVEFGGDPSALLEHEALAALVRHQHLSGNDSATSADVLERALSNVPDVAAARNVLRVWRGRDQELHQAARLSAQLMPNRWSFDGVIHLVAGYDIGVAAPPDIALNVAHAHFCARPTELAFYATHEAHHVGFLGLRSMPSIPQAVRTRAGLRGLVRFITQMEGMAVHAAEPSRRAAGARSGDDDYQIYLDPDAAETVRVAFAHHWRSIAGDAPLEGALVGETLDAMSSGQRLWYRFGALVCRELEAQGGTSPLASSITDAELFWRTATGLMERSSVGSTLPRVRR